MAVPSFRPDQYEKLSKKHKLIYWSVVTVVCVFIASTWILGAWWH